MGWLRFTEPSSIREPSPILQVVRSALLRGRNKTASVSENRPTWSGISTEKPSCSRIGVAGQLLDVLQHDGHLLEQVPRPAVVHVQESLAVRASNRAVLSSVGQDLGLLGNRNGWSGHEIS